MYPYKNIIIKTITLITIIITISQKASGQTLNNGIFFQAVARDNFSNPAMNRKIYIQSSIIQTTATGKKVITEEYQATTDATGVFSISVGQGKRISGTVNNLAGIDWANGPYFLSLKIAITPIAPATTWDYNSEWINLGTTSFGAVPYALYAGTAAGLNDKLNITDTSSMLAIYAKVNAIKMLETIVGAKIASTDTAEMLAPYKKIINEIIASNITSLTADAINYSLNTKLNLVDSNKIYVTPTQLAAKTFDVSPINSSIATKLNIADSINNYVTPTQLAAKTFDISPINSSIATKLNIADSIYNYVTPTQLAAKTFDISPINISIASKVDKIVGKELSSNDYTNTEKDKLAAISGNNTGDQDLSSYATNANLNLKINIADTSAMLSDRINRDTSFLSNRINLKANSSDVVSNLALKANITDVNAGLDLKVDKQTGKVLSSNDYTNTEKAKLAAISGNNTGDQDLSSYATNANLNLKLNISDTALMLSNRINRDTSFLSNRINLKANSHDVIADLALKANTTDLIVGLDLKVDKQTGKILSSNDYTNSEKGKLAAISGNNTGDQDLSSYATNANLNLKINIADTSTMLSDRIKRDTAALSNRINLKANTTDVINDLALKQALIASGTTSQFYRGDKTWQNISYSSIGASPTAGSTSITTLGTITSGTWNGTTIAVANGGTGATSLTASGVLIGNATSPVTTVAPSTNGNVLTSNGTSWISGTPSVSLIREIANEFSATTSQTSFTLTQTPSVNSKVKMYINGVRISNSAYSITGTTLTYNATNNGAYYLTASDRIQFDYYY